MKRYFTDQTFSVALRRTTTLLHPALLDLPGETL
jgi:hypothetical protein